MRERINRLAKGMIDIQIPEVVLNPSEIKLNVRKDIITKGEVYITSANNIHIKGLIYSSNSRIQVANNAFGGLRNHINYEVNANYLEHGDIIEGCFHLITSGGEKKIPYSFQVELGGSGQLLGGLKTPEDFAKLAKSDWNAALQLFEYQEFKEAPFMQNTTIHTIYDGLRGRGNRHNLLEEFLVSLDVKEAVHFVTSHKERLYDNPIELVEDTIMIEKNTWGFLCIDVKAEGDFIELSKSTITEQDFVGNEYCLTYRIRPTRLHPGKNLGSILLSTVRDVVTIPIEALGDETVDISDGDISAYKDGYLRYLSYRLDYESDTYEKALLKNQMERELAQLQRIQGGLEILPLLQAELSILSDHMAEACLMLDDCKDKILSIRQDERELYCFYQYLLLQIKPNEVQKESLVRLIHKYLEEFPSGFYLYLLLLKLDHGLWENPESLFADMKHQYKAGCYSPFLYVAACKLLNTNSNLLKSMDSFELHCLNLGAKKGMVGEDLALVIAKIAGTTKSYHNLYYRLLVRLYESYPKTALLTAICCMLIRGENRSAEAFHWYEKGIEANISLTRLYEYFLFSLPKGYDKLLPREVLLYFSYENQLDRHSKSILYVNILLYLDPKSSIYEDYERDIEQFAMEQLFQSRINSRLAVIYEHMIYKDVIDIPIAKVLPSVLCSYGVDCAYKHMKYVIVCHEELTEEDAFPLIDGTAYVPLFSEHNVLLFQDGYGNRYINVPYEKRQIMHKPELEERCFEVYPEHPRLRLQSCQEIMKHQVTEPSEIKLLEGVLLDIPLRPLYQKQILSELVAYHQRQSEHDQTGFSNVGEEYLLKLDYKSLLPKERKSICETLINRGYIKEAYPMIKEYGHESISVKSLLKLCAKMILEQLFVQDELLLQLAYEIFAQDKSDGVILDYLCEHYNGTAQQMYQILIRALSEHVETYDLEERLAAQMMFSGCFDHLDHVFELYAKRKKTSESIIRAYFTIKSVSYFLEEKPCDDLVFFYLERAIASISDKQKVPTIYLLALTKYDASCQNLSAEQIDLCRSMMEVLLDSGMVFPYYRQLVDSVPIPEDIMDKGMIEYHGSKEDKLELRVRITPDEETYHVEEIKRIYQGVFVKQKILFDGETLEYQLYEIDGVKQKLVKEGSVACPASVGTVEGSRFAYLNDIGLFYRLKEEESMKQKMNEYLTKDVMVEELFQLM